MSAQSEDLKRRATVFAVRVLRLIDALPHTASADVIGRQLARSGTSIMANYRAACLARSRAEFIAKLGVVLEEADESVCWLELLADTNPAATLDAMRAEAVELRAIFGRSLGTARFNASHIK